MDELVLRGAREHNLKGVDVRIPRNALVCFTGVSGSGKSSLAYDTIYREGQRRYLESLSSYARQFLGNLEKPKLDHIEGLSPTVAIDQKSVSRNPRSTVGTITETWDFLRLLMARLGVPHCPECGSEVRAMAPKQIVDSILREGNQGDRLLVLAPVVRGRKGSYRKELAQWRRDGYVRVRVDGQVLRLDEDIELGRYHKHDIELVLDRVKLDASKRERLLDSIELAISVGEGFAATLRQDAGSERYTLFSALRACPEGHGALPELEPVLFSFNGPQGACPDCDGLGERRGIAEELLVRAPELSIKDGALNCLNPKGFVLFTRFHVDHLDQVLRDFGSSIEHPLEGMSDLQQEVLFYGAGERVYEFGFKHQGKKFAVEGKDRRQFPGLVGLLQKVWDEYRPKAMSRLMHARRCPSCDGQRLGPVPRSVRFEGRNIGELAAMTIGEAQRYFAEQSEAIEKGAGARAEIGRELFRELNERLYFLAKVGLEYLRLDRSAATLSGGESQRIRLAAQVGSGLRGVLYVLDEPSIGLHARDNARLIETLHELRDRGNTVCVVEHDEETMRNSDWLVDVGPGAGVLGGEIVASGPPEQVLAGSSLTARFLKGEERIELPERRPRPKDWLKLQGVAQHNLQNVDVEIPLGRLVCVSGVSGSGKSSLVHHVLHKILARELNGAEMVPGKYRKISGHEQLEKVIEIDQAPIGRTPRSNPATYTGVWTLIRDLYTLLPESRQRGYAKGRFSFNVKGGRCEACQGAGVRQLEMQLLESVEVTCEVCGGTRFNRETLEILFKGRSVADLLEMSISEARDFFRVHPKISRILSVLEEVGLGYVRLGQRSTTLSGGEAQRIKLASELARPSQGGSFYILDEPTTGLHFDDVRKLLAALQRLVEEGNSVLVIEHDLDVLKCADWVLDLGPEGGDGGGRLLAAGTPEEIVLCEESYTGRALASVLRRGPRPGPKPAKTAKPRKKRKAGRPRKKRPAEDLVVYGARQHNLRQVNVRFPAASLSVVTGLSGSGKTSLAFDTVFREGQRRFIESLSTYARRFLGRLERAPVERIDGLLPAIAIDQKTAGRNPRSTVGTQTEVLDYLRLLFARVGLPHCPLHGDVLEVQSPSMLAARVVREREGAKGMVLAPLRLPPGITDEDLELFFDEQRQEWREEGLARYALGEDALEIHRLDDEVDALELRKGLWLVVDRVSYAKRTQSRIAEAFELAGHWGKGRVAIADIDASPQVFSLERACPKCEVALPIDLHPRFFSFNHHQGACPDCHGLGTRKSVSLEALIQDESKPLFDGALPRNYGAGLGWLFHPSKAFARRAYAMAAAKKFDLRGTSWRKLSTKQKDYLLWGTGESEYSVEVKSSSRGRERHWTSKETWPGIARVLEERFGQRESDAAFKNLGQYLHEEVCRTCQGRRLSEMACAVELSGASLPELCADDLLSLRSFFQELKLSSSEKQVAKEILSEINARLSFLADMGLGYLSLDRRSSTLSGGEAQRIRLASQLGSRLTGTLYVLDEPTVGLHPRDTERLLGSLEGLRELGNTVIAVEHDEEVIRRADWVVDMGPGAGRHGGDLVYQGKPAGLLRTKGSLTGEWLSGQRQWPERAERRRGKGRLRLQQVRTHNLKAVDAEFLYGAFNCVTGVSGSGKSSLVMESLLPALRGEKGEWKLSGASAVEAIIVVNQEALGATPRSTPATYTGILAPIRDLFARSEHARRLGFGPGRFSFNAAQGRCPACEGRGQIQVEMHFLADVWVTCELCKGQRYNEGTLAVKWRGKSIADVLEMEVKEALEFFDAHKKVKRALRVLSQVGLGYLQLGQGVHTLSGGEAQRLKLAAELCKAPRPGQLFLLDEPTTGLHMEDVCKLLGVLDRIIERGGTAIVIEHHPDVARHADWLLDLGPEGGDGGGELVAMGTPEEVMASKASWTGRYLGTK
ncbi:MAG: excinuclease ABC subunit A [Planctomycetota bacterium]|nr:MAG: excinuclease ABC subunit A [Planctomycetota bacterium]